MLEIVQILKEKHYTNTKAMTVTLAKCLRCGKVSKVLRQNVTKHNKKGSKYCQHCVQDKYHFMTNTRIWRIWQGMKQRAADATDVNYGGRGISVCMAWMNFETFFADMGDGYADDLTIERKDVNQPYSKDNCCWVSMFAQQGNKRTTRWVTYQGDRIHLAELCRRTGLGKMMLATRLNNGMTADEAAEDARQSPYGKSANPKNVRRRQKRMSMT